MPLTDTAIRNAKPKEKAYKIQDGKGLYVLVTSTGKYFRFDYRFNEKRKTLALGVYPDTTLSKAREKLLESRQQIANGIDPGELRKLNKRAKKEQAANSFEAIAREWLATKVPGWKKSHSEKVIARLENDIFPAIGGQPISQISAPELLIVLKRIESRGAIDTAHRARNNCSQIFRYAIQVGGRAERDPAGDLRGGLQSAQYKNFASITEPRKIGELLRVIAGYSGSFIVKCALNLAPLVFVRPGELRNAEWQEIDLELMEWRIPGEKMKRGKNHIVPLSRQAVLILEELLPFTGHGKYLFPSVRTESRPMSENTVNGALRRLGYTVEEMTGHGFRAMASTCLYEQGWPSDVIERQLAHSERNKTKAAYNFAEYLPERRKMMQAWADYLDVLKGGVRVDQPQVELA